MGWFYSYSTKILGTTGLIDVIGTIFDLRAPARLHQPTGHWQFGLVVEDRANVQQQNKGTSQDLENCLVNSELLVVFWGGFLKKKSPGKNWVKWVNEL